MKTKISFSVRNFFPVFILMCITLFSFFPLQAGAQFSPEAEQAFRTANLPINRANANNFALPLLSGGNTSLSELNGNVIILYFWATWCPSCVEGMPLLESLHQRFKGQGLEIIAVNGGEKRTLVERFINNNRYNFKVALDTNNRVTGQYGVRAIPAVFILERNGRIISSFTGGRPWTNAVHTAAIDALLKSGTSETPQQPPAASTPETNKNIPAWITGSWAEPDINNKIDRIWTFNSDGSGKLAGLAGSRMANYNFYFSFNHAGTVLTVSFDDNEIWIYNIQRINDRQLRLDDTPTAARYRGNTRSFYTLNRHDTASAAPTPQQPPAQITNANEFERHVFELTNIERTNRGLRPLLWDDRLGKAARAHSEDMARNRSLSHTGSDRSSHSDRISRAGFNWSKTAENIASGQRTPEDVLRTWMNSPGHRANILDPALTHIGVGFASNYWTQKFAAPR